MFEMPEAIALGTLFVSAGGVSITAICSKYRQKNGNGNGSGVSETLCQTRWGGVRENIDHIRHTQEDIFKELKDIRRDIQRQA